MAHLSKVDSTLYPERTRVAGFATACVGSCVPECTPLSPRGTRAAGPWGRPWPPARVRPTRPLRSAGGPASTRPPPRRADPRVPVRRRARFGPTKRKSRNGFWRGQPNRATRPSLSRTGSPKTRPKTRGPDPVQRSRRSATERFPDGWPNGASPARVSSHVVDAAAATGWNNTAVGHFGDSCHVLGVRPCCVQLDSVHREGVDATLLTRLEPLHCKVGHPAQPRGHLTGSFGDVRQGGGHEDGFAREL